MIRSIIIRFDEAKNLFQIEETGRACPELTWDEMLGQIAEMTHPKIGKGRYPMLSADDLDKERARRIDRENLWERENGQ
ncbi:hypothetical protein N5K27_22605 [Pigmentiphaga sp. GD03639]|uniref:hypothetical protein n=1 Tax=Pigmentiphaga sp. GD03639 TaxID=2975354 RepID=UPI00244A6890|nr:hypothetical protein [Pigmentiphaga sp. GD03639]MDH2239104.1 hypothetical protein [Pigmentiphaga sp. GD03639]